VSMHTPCVALTDSGTAAHLHGTGVNGVVRLPLQPQPLIRRRWRGFMPTMQAAHNATDKRHATERRCGVRLLYVLGLLEHGCRPSHVAVVAVRLCCWCRGSSISGGHGYPSRYSQLLVFNVSDGLLGASRPRQAQQVPCQLGLLRALSCALSLHTTAQPLHIYEKTCSQQ
jgi:hypothetical protein